MGVVSNSIFRRRKGVELLWDKVFAGNNPIFIQSPSALVMNAIEGRTPGKALDIGMGQGRRRDGMSPASTRLAKGFDDLTKDDAERFLRALKPGGIVVYENGADESNSVLRAFPGYQIIRFEDIQTSGFTNAWRNSYWMTICSHVLKKNLFPFIYNKITHTEACYSRTAC